MTTDDSTKRSQRDKWEEWSTPTGLLFLASAVGMAVAWYLHGPVGPAIGSMALGVATAALLLHPEIRLYVYHDPPLQRWLEADDDWR